MRNQVYILNAIPGACVPNKGCALDLAPISWGLFRRSVEDKQALSAIGHEDTARLISEMSGCDISCNRISVPTFDSGDEHLIVLYKGPRLPEGVTTLPEGASLQPYSLLVV